MIHPIVSPPGGYSYPSGHATHSYAFATILGQSFSRIQAQAFLDRAHAIAQSRVDAGVHYPSDIREGEIVGKGDRQGTTGQAGVPARDASCQSGSCREEVARLAFDFSGDGRIKNPAFGARTAF